jgi:hypothetical protein
MHINAHTQCQAKGNWKLHEFNINEGRGTVGQLSVEIRAIGNHLEMNFEKITRIDNNLWQFLKYLRNYESGSLQCSQKTTTLS